ncbi:MAG: WbqC family protein [Bacteroidales bacterium]
MNNSCSYLGSVREYAAQLAAGNVQFDLNAPRVWEHNHCNILAANGVLTLTVPLQKPSKGDKTPIKELLISEHGDWTRIHWGAIFSAYGKAPFFDYIQDDLHAIYETHDRWLVDFNQRLHQLVIDFLDLPINKNIGNTPILTNTVKDIEYYQLLRKNRSEFIPNLSIIDLLMNCGRESIITLNKMG